MREVSRCQHTIKGELRLLQSLKGSGKFHSDTIIPPNPPPLLPFPEALNHKRCVTSRDYVISFLPRNVLNYSVGSCCILPKGEFEP